ncbi:DUF676-domain-containing protein [Peniophora sp. CONT]|nr:DUF676-domain-containing protein [Peniophora sp. CONT]
MTEQSYPTHLLVLVHGKLDVAPKDHLSLVTLAVPQPGTFLCLTTDPSGGNGGEYFSVDWDGEKVVQEILATLQMCKGRGQPISEISFFGFNIGGLLARYAVGILHQMKVFSEVKPRNFDTFGTPHVGLAMPQSWWKKFLVRKAFLPWMEQIAFIDSWEDSGRPLLDVMSDTNSVFVRGLSLFDSVRVYANAIGDGMVPYMSAAIEEVDPFVDYKNSGIVVDTYDERSRYGSLIKSWHTPAQPPLSPHPILRYIRRTLWRRSTAYAVFLTVIATLTIAIGTPFLWYLLFMAIGCLYLAISTLGFAVFSNASTRSRTGRLIAKRQRLLNTSRVFADPDEVAEEGYRAIDSKAQTTVKSTMHTTFSATASPTTNTNNSSSRFTPIQLYAIANLNTLPQLHKEAVWRPGCFTPHRALLGLGTLGQPNTKRTGILRHWSDGLLH